MKTNQPNQPKALTPRNLSPYRAYLKGRILVALNLQGNEECDVKGVHLAVQADCLANVLSEEAAIALAIGVTQSAKDPVLSKAIIETMVAACLESPPKTPTSSGAPAKIVKRGRPRLKLDGVSTGRLPSRKSVQGNTPTSLAQS